MFSVAPRELIIIPENAIHHQTNRKNKLLFINDITVEKLTPINPTAKKGPPMTAIPPTHKETLAVRIKFLVAGIVIAECIYP